MAVSALAALLVVSVTTVAGAQDMPALSLDGVLAGHTSEASPALFAFNAPAAGVLTVAVRATDDTDLTIAITDDVGQPLADGESDNDLGGNTGAEQLAVTIPRAGDYRVRVGAFNGSGGFNLVGGWTAFPEVEMAADPDGRPTEASPLMPGSPTVDTLDGSQGDNWDWFSVSSDASGAVTVVVEAPEGDLVLEAFREGDYIESVSRSDQDMEGVTGNESVTTRIEGGQTLYFKVSTLSPSLERVPYTVRAGVI